MCPYLLDCLLTIAAQVDGRELHFSMVDGDFKKFEGKWSVRAGPRWASGGHFYALFVTYAFSEHLAF